jgi:hypothetical protein
MTSQDVLSALQLPAESHIDQRITKKLLLERSRGTAAQKRSLQDGIEELVWIAALKPNTVGVASYRDETREYLEIAVLLVRLRENAKANRLAELIHRAVPYPVLLIADQSGEIFLSLAHKRWSEAEHGETVAEEVDHVSLTHNWMDAGAVDIAKFLKSLGLATLRAADMRALYQGWIDRMTAFRAFIISGTYAVPKTSQDALLLRRALSAHANLAREMTGLRAQAQKEVQVSRRVDFNLAIKRIEAEMAATLLSFRSAAEESAVGSSTTYGLGEAEKR